MRVRDIVVGGEYALKLTKPVKEYLEDMNITYLENTPLVVSGICYDEDTFIQFIIDGNKSHFYPREVVPVKSLEQLMEEFINREQLHSKAAA